MKKLNLRIDRYALALCLLYCTYTVNAQKVKEDVQISIADVVGSDCKEGIDIRELEENRIVVEDYGDRPFVTVEQMPQFVGGQDSLMRFIKSNLTYPRKAQDDGVQGRVVVRFVVNKLGKIVDAKVIRGIDPNCDREALRIVLAMPKWLPGKQNGQPVSVYYTLPVMFKLTPNGVEKSEEDVKVEKNQDKIN